MKALIVIEIPEDHFLVTANDLYERLKGYKCDLIPMPQKKEVEVNEIEDLMHIEYSIEDIYTNKYIATIRLATDKLISLGWNACLDEITGKDCRKCVHWETCVNGKEGHEKGTSQGYSIGECQYFEKVESSNESNTCD